MNMDAGRCWQSSSIVSSKPSRATSLPIGFFLENDSSSHSASSNGKPIRRSNSASFNCQLMENSLLRSLFKTQSVESREYLKGSDRNRTRAMISSTKLRPCPYISPNVVSNGARRIFWHNNMTVSPRETGVDEDAGICRAACGDNWEEVFGGRVEELALECYLNDQEGEMPVTCGKVAGEVSLGARYSSENSVVHKDLRSSLGSVYFSGRPFGGTGGPNSHDLEGVGKEQKVLSHVRGLDKEIVEVENCPVGIQAGAAKMPLSLRMLKRRQQKQAKVLGNTGGDVKGKLMGFGESFKKAFSSMVYMIRILQSHTLHIRQLLFCEDMQELVNMVHRDMHLSFLWLFQQVFSCTPKLMLLVMVLLTDFTVFSIGNNVALANITPSAYPSALVSVCSDELRRPEVGRVVHFVGQSQGGPEIYLQNLLEFRPPLVERKFVPLDTDNGKAGNGGSKGPKVAGGEDGDAWSEQDALSRTMYSKDESMPTFVTSPSDSSIEILDRGLELPSSHSRKMDDDALEGEEFCMLRHLWKEASEDLVSLEGEIRNAVALDQQTMQRLVAPVSAQLEPDNYVCYDQTDLIYQYALLTDCKNPMLLANYAQFLYLVRHDYNRAEEFFRRAMKADPVDGEAIGRFATFLWLARGDCTAAEGAYKAAIAADPNNPFHAGSYAHFLWHSGEEDLSCPISPLA